MIILRATLSCSNTNGEFFGDRNIEDIEMIDPEAMTEFKENDPILDFMWIGFTVVKK